MILRRQDKTRQRTRHKTQETRDKRQDKTRQDKKRNKTPRQQVTPGVREQQKHHFQK